MNIGIIGMGVVGAAIHEGFQSKGHTLYANDIKDMVYPLSALDELVEKCEVIFICVPTPRREDGSCDLSIVYSVFNALHFRIAKLTKDPEFEPPIVAIKSTVLPGTTDSLSVMYPFVCSNPEFMTEASPLEDFLNPDRIIIGTRNNRAARKMKELYEEFDCTVWVVTPREAEAIKYLANSLLLTKVAFSQEILRLCLTLDLDPETVYSAVVEDKRINGHHLNPMLGRIASDSKCLPKDTLALITQLDKSGGASPLLKAVYATAVEGARLGLKLTISEETK